MSNISGIGSNIAGDELVVSGDSDLYWSSGNGDDFCTSLSWISNRSRGDCDFPCFNTGYDALVDRGDCGIAGFPSNGLVLTSFDGGSQGDGSFFFNGVSSFNANFNVSS
jgi:hypothetical protein